MFGWHKELDQIFVLVVNRSTKFKAATVGDLADALKLLKRTKDKSSHFSIPSGMGSVDCWSLELFTDASLGNLDKYSSTSGFILFIKGKDGRMVPLNWNSKRTS